MFFFFKQKTAYEMRISDLSSDVCSSDLVLATGVPFLGIVDAELQAKFLRQMDAVMGRIAGIRRFGSAALDLAYVAAGRYDGYWENGLKPWDVAAGQIGGASCREGVWQDGSNSWVSGSLNKKKIKQ